MVTRWRKQAGRRPSRNLRELSCGLRRCRKELVLPVASAGGRRVSLTYVSDAGAREEQSSSKSLRQDHGARHLLTRAGVGFPTSAGAAAASDTGAQKGPASEATRVMLAIPHSPPRMLFPAPLPPPAISRCHG